MVHSLIQILLCSINVFSVAGQKPSAAGRERTAYAGDFAVPSALATSGKAHALLANIANWCLNLLACLLMLRRTDLQRLEHTRTHLCLSCSTPSVCNNYIWLHWLGRLRRNHAGIVIQLTSCYCKMSLHTNLTNCHCTASAHHTQDHNWSQVMTTVLPHVCCANVIAVYTNWSFANCRIGPCKLHPAPQRVFQQHSIIIRP